MEEDLKKKLISRLNRVEGQVSGVRNMVDKGEYCVDVLNQITAAQSALGRVGSMILQNHLETCVLGAFESGNERDAHKKIEEIIEVFDKYGRVGSR